MARRNTPKHPRRPVDTARYDMDYVFLPEHPRLMRIIAKPLKTIFINMDADFEADDTHVARSMNDPILRKIAQQIGGVA